MNWDIFSPYSIGRSLDPEWSAAGLASPLLVFRSKITYARPSRSADVFVGNVTAGQFVAHFFELVGIENSTHRNSRGCHYYLLFTLGREHDDR
jgi:hypothetical protein